jgi:hypothetical protein
MKNSNKLLWFTVGSLFGCVMVCLVVLKLAVPYQ